MSQIQLNFLSSNNSRKPAVPYSCCTFFYHFRLSQMIAIKWNLYAKPFDPEKITSKIEATSGKNRNVPEKQK